MKALNKVQLIGNVGQDPESRTTGTGKKVVTISLATERPYGDHKTDWHRVQAWGKLGEVFEQWVKKGDRIYIEGKIEYSQWKDDSGNTRYSTDINTDELIMLGSKEGGSGKKAAPKKETKKPPQQVDDDQELPF